MVCCLPVDSFKPIRYVFARSWEMHRLTVSDYITYQRSNCVYSFRKICTLRAKILTQNNLHFLGWVSLVKRPQISLQRFFTILVSAEA